VTITSLGGTPAYAAGCTFKRTFILQDCRNTDQGKCPGSVHTQLAYHPLQNPPAGSGLSIGNPITDNNGVCCTQFPVPNPFPTLSFDGTNQKCVIKFEAYADNSNCKDRDQGALLLSRSFPSTGPTDVSPITIDTSCPNPVTTPDLSNAFWTLFVVCNSKAAPDSCYTP